MIGSGWLLMNQWNINLSKRSIRVSISLRRQPDAHHFVYYQDKKPVGFISYYFDSPFAVQVQFVYVDRDHRRQGIAEKYRGYYAAHAQEGASTVDMSLTRLIKHWRTRRLTKNSALETHARERQIRLFAVHVLILNLCYHFEILSQSRRTRRIDRNEARAGRRCPIANLAQNKDNQKYEALLQ